MGGFHGTVSHGGFCGRPHGTVPYGGVMGWFPREASRGWSSMLARERFTRAATLNFDKWTFVRSFSFGWGAFMADVLFGSGFVRSNFDLGFCLCVFLCELPSLTVM